MATPAGGASLVSGAVRWLGAHPTRKTLWNWVIWSVGLLVLIGFVTSPGKKQTSSTGPLPTGSSAAPSLESTGSASSTASATHASSTAAAPISSAAKSKAAPTRRASSPAATSGGFVLNASGAVLPNATRTPGALNPDVTQANIHSTICVSGWTSTVRPPSSVTTALKEEQLATGYAYQGDMNTGDYEEDHLISLELGGSPASPLNLWPEPYNVPEGARVKDQVENKLHSLVCSGALSLATAQHAIASNWWQAYETYVGGAPTSSAAPAPVSSTVSHTSAPASTSASALSCTASMSNSTPAQHSTVYVYVHTAAGAAVTATAHYKSTNTTHTGTASSSGTASVAFSISRASIGYTVVVDVSVTAHGSSASCSTSFTPQ